MREFKVVYTGKAISLNDFYSQGHWSSRNATKNKFKKIFSILMLEAKFKKVDRFKLDVLFNSRHDTDNIVGMTKIFVDTMKGKYIKEDNRNHYKALSIAYDDSLKHNTFIFKVTEIE